LSQPCVSFDRPFEEFAQYRLGSACRRLGLTSFGGPIAHLGYFRDAFVVRRRWLEEETYADLVALAQFLPGPASSKVGIAIGLTAQAIRAHWRHSPHSVRLRCFGNTLGSGSDRARATIVVAAADMMLALPSAWGQVGAILLGGVVGFTLLRDASRIDHVALPHAVLGSPKAMEQ
jgi:chromate transporter